MIVGDLREGLLVGYGPMQWTDARALLDGFRAIWADLDGWHVAGEALPNNSPVTTHLWAWHPESARWARARFDESTAIVGVLDGDDKDTSATEAASVEQVTFTIREGVPWGNDRQIPPQGDAIRGLRFDIATIRGITPIAFVNLHDGP